MELLRVISLFLCIQLCIAGNLRGINDTHMFVRPTANYRILLFATSFEEDGEPKTAEQIAAVPIIGGKEVTEALYEIDLPNNFVEDHFEAIAKGNLFVAITDSQVVNNQVHLARNSQIETILDPRHRARSSKPLAKGKKTITIVRVSTMDSTPSHTAESLIDGLFSDDKINLKTQFKACSFGQLKFELSKHKVIEIKVDRPVSDFLNGTSLVTAAQNAMREKLNIKDPSKLSDKVMMCLPPGTGNWVASSGVGHWRSQYNDKWCRSLTATMHELGHGIGLIHANEKGHIYGDATGYMAAGHPQYYWPQKCFNGQNNHQLGWFSSREKLIQKSQLKAGGLFNLATFVDFDRTSNTEPVLVNVADDIFLQYNVAKDFNVDTEEKIDEVTVTTITEKGSDVLAGLEPGENITIPEYQGTSRSLVIEACGKRIGSRGADVMLVSVSLDRSLCNQEFSEFFNNYLDSIGFEKPTNVASPSTTYSKVSKPPPVKKPNRPPSQAPARLGFWELLKSLGITFPGESDTSMKLKDERPALPITNADASGPDEVDNQDVLASTPKPYTSGVKSVFEYDDP